MNSVYAAFTKNETFVRAAESVILIVLIVVKVVILIGIIMVIVIEIIVNARRNGKDGFFVIISVISIVEIITVVHVIIVIVGIVAVIKIAVLVQVIVLIVGIVDIVPIIAVIPVVIFKVVKIIIGEIELVLIVPVVAVIPVVISVDVRLQHLAGVGIHLVLIFHAARGELKLIYAVVQLILVVAEGGALQTQLRQHQLLCLVLTDVSGIVQIALADGHGLRVDAAFLHRLTDAVGYILQKLVAHIDRAFLQLQNDVLGVSVRIFSK